MSGISKRVSGSWVSGDYGIIKTATDTITPPTTLYGDGTNASLTIKGNTVQNGTPSSSNPVDVVGCGERTENLFSSVWEQGTINANGQNEPSNIRIRTADYVEVKPNTIYSMSRNINVDFMNIRFYKSDKSFVGTGSASTIRLISGYSEGNPMYSEKFCCFEIIDNTIKYMRCADQSNNLLTKYMMVEGEYTEQTMPTYEPYGYKIQFLNGSVTTIAYLGDVQTTRNIIKYELTGGENWIRESGNTYALEGVEQTAIGYANALCTHYVLATTYNTLIGTDGTFSVSRRPVLFIHDENFTSAAQLKTYLATQYANGTPVVIYYALNTPETAVVNEPLQKIGDYSDSLSTSIVTTDGANSLSVDTTVQPSEVTANYHGWHPVSSAHERNNGAWT